MAQYLIRLVHTSDQCPTSNSKVRERVLKGMPEMPQLAAKLGVKFVIGPLVLAAEHESFAVVEAEKPEAVQDLIFQSGLIQWNTVRVTLTQPLQDAMKELDKIPPPIY